MAGGMTGGFIGLFTVGGLGAKFFGSTPGRLTGGVIGCFFDNTFQHKLYCNWELTCDYERKIFHGPITTKTYVRDGFFDNSARWQLTRFDIVKKN